MNSEQFAKEYPLITIEKAEKICKGHNVTLEELIKEDRTIKKKESIKTRKLLDLLGY